MNMKDDNQILEYYNAGAEKGRLENGIGKIEFLRTKQIITRYLSNEKKLIYDIGGGTGTYSRWLASLGHEVHMFELAPEAVEYAKSHNDDIKPIYKIEVADARKINRENERADIVLVMGPIYHLTERKERINALLEAKRVLKKDGLMFITTISRFGSMLWGLSVYGERSNLIDENEFMEMINRELTDGQHIRPEKYPGFIPRSYFHLSSDLRDEVKEAGLRMEKIISIEGPIWFTPKFEEKWQDKNSRERLLQIAEKVEEEESLMGMSPHLLGIARKNN